MSGIRVLFVTYAERTHFLAMAPLAWAFRTAGHEVVFATQPAFVEEITRAGLTAVSVGRYRDPARMMELAGDMDARMGFPMPYDVAEQRPEDISWDYLREGFRRQVRDWHKTENVPMIPDLVAFAQSWRPDLVIWEPSTYAGSIAAKACGAAHGRLMFSQDIFGVTRHHYRRLMAQHADPTDPMADWLGAYARSVGSDFSEDMITGQFTIDQFPAALRIESPDLTYIPMRYTPYGGVSTVPDWLRAPPARPRVALTLGLVATERFDGFVVDVQDILDHLAGLDIEVVATIPEREQRKLDRVPANARLVPFVPLAALVPTCDVVIHHAGFGTMSTTMLHAVPHLVLPWHFDEPPLAEGLVGLGAAIAIHTSKVTGPAVADAVRRLLTEPQFRAGAERARAELLALPTPNALVPQLVELAGRKGDG